MPLISRNRQPRLTHLLLQSWTFHERKPAVTEKPPPLPSRESLGAAFIKRTRSARSLRNRNQLTPRRRISSFPCRPAAAPAAC